MYYKATQAAIHNKRPYHLAAIAWRGNTPVAIGINSAKTHPKADRSYPNGINSACLHAEMHALFKCRGNCDRLEVFRIKSSGKFGMAKPCRLCQEHINRYGIKDVRYTNEEGQWTQL